MLSIRYPSFRHLAVALALVTLAGCSRPTSVALGPATEGPEPRPDRAAPAARAERHRGVCWVAGREVTADQVAALAEVGVTHISQTPFGWQRRFDQPEIGLVTEGRVFWGERDVGLETTTRLAQAHGVATLLKPHIWLTERVDGKWRSDIAMTSEEDWQAWFTNYRRFILHYAALAQRLDIEALAIGTELRRTVVERSDDWRRLIREVRSVYSGRLTYSANHWREFEEVPFWDELDFIGVQGYFPLTDRESPSLETLLAGWEPHHEALAAVQRRFGKPVVFTEIGYRPTADAAIEPWAWVSLDQAATLRVDPATQERCYEAFFRTFWHEPWFAGSYFWKWFPPMKARPERTFLDFTPQGWPALDVLAHWYRDSAAAGAGVR